jgi:hypothetical protein
MPHPANSDMMSFDIWNCFRHREVEVDGDIIQSFKGWKVPEVEARLSSIDII